MTDWIRVKLSDCLARVERPVNVVQDKHYTQIGIRSHGKGVFHKESVTGEELGNKAVYWVEPDCFVLNIVFAWEQAIGKTTASEAGMIASHRFPMYRPKDNLVDIDYLISFFMTKKGKDILEAASPGGAGRNRTLGQTRFMNSVITLPPITEQRKIAEILSAQDRIIELKTKLLEEKKRLKKYLCQMLLSGKKRTCDKYLEWDFYKLGNALSYEQPGKYIVRADNYKQSYCTPVLTAGKSFVLGYVDETDDVYQNVPVVIFDDFTTSSKYVDFPFKVKSSAIKILSANAGFDIYFMYEILQHIRYPISAHERHWISIFSKMEINLPCLREQREISKFLKTLNEEIDIYNDVIEKEKLKKKALMQLLLTGKIRVKV